MDDILALGRTWEQPELTSIGRLPMRSPTVPFPDAAATLDDRASSPWFRSLDGRWRFLLIDRPEADAGAYFPPLPSLGGEERMQVLTSSPLPSLGGEERMQ